LSARGDRVTRWNVLTGNWEKKCSKDGDGDVTASEELRGDKEPGAGHAEQLSDTFHCGKCTNML